MKIKIYLIPAAKIREALGGSVLSAVDLKIITDEEGVAVEGVPDTEEGEALYSFLSERFGSFFVYRDGISAAERTGAALKKAGYTLVTAESCTGGMIGGAVTDIPGSSEWFWGGFITYADDAKKKLGVPSPILQKEGAVSSETVIAMAENALKRSGADIAVSVSGIAGPGGGSIKDPTGTVWFGIAGNGKRSGSYLFRFSGGRDLVRKKSVAAALLIVEKFIRGLTVSTYCE